jgi:hypothetical protein
VSSNQPAGKVAIFLTPAQIEFLIRNCESNEQYAINQLLAWSTLPPEELESIKPSFLKLDGIKNEFRELRQTVEAQKDA